jgi:glycopeptide antibiotics resistance protein
VVIFMNKIYNGPESLRWLLPVSFGTIMEFLFLANIVTAKTLNTHSSLMIVVIPFCVIAPLGGWWAVYQCLRHERQIGKCLAIVVFVPLGFFWYYFERYLPRINNSLPVAE